MLNSNSKTIWKDIPGYEDHYQASNTGKVRSLKDSHGNKVKRKRKPYKSKNGYLNIDLYINDVRYHESVHRLVALAFIPNPENKLTVNHINGVKEDNNVSNLEWSTYSENLKHAHALGLNKSPKSQLGIKNGNTSKYNNVSYDESRNRWIATMKINGKQNVKRFPVSKYGDQAEMLAAKAVNDMIKEFGLKDRALNTI